MTRSLHKITVVAGSSSDTSRTQVLALALAQAVAERVPARLELLALHKLAPAIGVSTAAQGLPSAGRQALDAITGADLVIAVTPVYKASYSGLFKHLFDLVPPEALVGKPVLLAANGGSDRHALVVDHQLRPLFAFFRALTVPSAVYASDADFEGHALREGPLRARIAEAAEQAARLLAASTVRLDLPQALPAAA